MKPRTVILICLLLLSACHIHLNAFEIEWKSLSGEVEIKAENSSVTSVRLLKGKGRVRGCTVKVGKPSCVRLRCDVQDPVTSTGPNSTIISVGNGPDSFSFFLRDVNATSPIWIPEYQVVVLPDGVFMSYDEVVELIKSRHLVSKMEQIEQAEEASFEAAEKVTRNMSVPIWLGISRDIRLFEITEELPDATSTFQADKTVVPNLASTQLIDESISDHPLSYKYSFSRGVGPYDNITRSLEDGVFPIYISVTEDDDVVYQSKSFVTLEKSTLTQENVRGTHYMISDNYSQGRTWTETQQKQLAEILANTPVPEEETVLVIHTVVTNKGTSRDMPG